MLGGQSTAEYKILEKSAEERDWQGEKRRLVGRRDSRPGAGGGLDEGRGREAQARETKRSCCQGQRLPLLCLRPGEVFPPKSRTWPHSNVLCFF